MHGLEKLLKDIAEFRIDHDNIAALADEIVTAHEKADQLVLRLIEPSLSELNNILRKMYERAAQAYVLLKRTLPYTILNITYKPGQLIYEINANILNRAKMLYVIQAEDFNTDVLIEHVAYLVEELDDELNSRNDYEPTY